MARKKEQTTLSPEENQQVQNLLSQYRQIAQGLQQSKNQAEAEFALTGLHTLSEAAQLALIKALAKEPESDAADILLAINTFNPDKELRKDARRGLMRLETLKVVPRWKPPIVRTAAVQVNIANPPRFWKGLVTQSREQGEVQLLLMWEQGFDYAEVRSISLLLDYWRDGVRDAAIEIVSKRNINERLESTRSRMREIALVDCTLAEGKRLLEEALTVNEWRGTEPHKDYKLNQPLIKRFILQATDPGEDRGKTFIDPELTDQEAVINFLGAWSLGDYGLAYDLLSHDSALSEGMAREEWIVRRRAWSDEAQPARLELGFVREREQRTSALWVPAAASGLRAASRKDVELGWSLELSETPLSGTLREMPLGTAVNKETRRHWFWSGYTVVQEENVWRIQRTSDEGALLQGLSVNDLQRRIKEYEEAIDAIVKRRESNVEAFMEEVSWRLTQLLHFHDALIARLPLDRKVCEDAYNSSVLMGNPERIMVYLERLAQRFPEQHTEMLRSLAATQISYAYSNLTQNLPERRQHFLALAEETLRNAIADEDSAMTHALLAELFMSMERNDDARSEFLAARSLHPDREAEIAIEAGLGNLAMRGERFEEALTHFQQIYKLDPASPGILFSLGFAHRWLKHYEEAEQYYLQAIRKEPEDIRSYSELIAIYMNRPDAQEARRIAELGVRKNPESAHLHALYASVLYEMGETRAAQRRLEEAESIDPELEIVQSVREHLKRPRGK